MTELTAREVIEASIQRNSVDEPNLKDFADMADELLADLRRHGYEIVLTADADRRWCRREGR